MTNEELKRDLRRRQEIRSLWREHGGRQHGPHTETMTMPEDNFDGFIEALISSTEERAEKAEGERDDLQRAICPAYTANTGRGPNGAFVEMARLTEEARRGALERAEHAESERDALKAENEQRGVAMTYLEQQISDLTDTENLVRDYYAAISEKAATEAENEKLREEREGLIQLAMRAGAKKVWEVTYEDGHISYAALNPGTGPSGNGVIASTRCILEHEMKSALKAKTDAGKG